VVSVCLAVFTRNRFLNIGMRSSVPTAPGPTFLSLPPPSPTRFSCPPSSVTRSELLCFPSTRMSTAPPWSTRGAAAYPSPRPSSPNCSPIQSASPLRIVCSCVRLCAPVCGCVRLCAPVRACVRLRLRLRVRVLALVCGCVRLCACVPVCLRVLFKPLLLRPCYLAHPTASPHRNASPPLKNMRPPFMCMTQVRGGGGPAAGGEGSGLGPPGPCPLLLPSRRRRADWGGGR
jgi:hypothetical protein